MTEGQACVDIAREQGYSSIVEYLEGVQVPSITSPTLRDLQKGSIPSKAPQVQFLPSALQKEKEVSRKEEPLVTVGGG